MKHSASPRFWALYRALPADVRELADKNFELLRQDSRHPSLHFKNLGKVWSARVGGHFRALAIAVDGGYQWIWIGSHAEYDKLAG